MSTVHKFKYPIFYSIVFVLGFLVMSTIIVGTIASAINEGGFLKVHENLNNIGSNIIVTIMFPVFLMTLTVISLKRIKYTFMKIYFDVERKKLTSERYGNIKEIKFSDIKSTNDLPNKGVLIIKDSFTSILIPKEISNYSHLYGLLEENGLIKENINFNNFETTLGIYFYVFGIEFLAFCLLPLCILPDLIKSFDGSLNAILALIILPATSLVMLSVILRLATKYKFTDEGIIEKHPLYKN